VLVVGDGPAKGDLEQLARDSGVADRIRFAGFQTNAGPWFSACDAFVLPSLTEGTPMALLEALAHKLPVVATRVGGVPDVITDQSNGLLVDSGDVAGLADAMRQLSENAARREALAAAGLAMVRARFGVQTWVRQTAEVYRRSLPAEVVQ
jgi:glycosyltransferase involved in cell wall biosynthesis